jgi:hypothetical protein
MTSLICEEILKDGKDPQEALATMVSKFYPEARRSADGDTVWMLIVIGGKLTTHIENNVDFGMKGEMAPHVDEETSVPPGEYGQYFQPLQITATLKYKISNEKFLIAPVALADEVTVRDIVNRHDASIMVTDRYASASPQDHMEMGDFERIISNQ